MMELSIGAVAAWQIAVWEAAWLKHQYVEKEHLLCGVCSLEKVLDNEKVELDEQARAALQAEQGGVLSVLREFEIDPVQFRRRIRAALGKGSHERTEKVIHRSEECKRVFEAAGELAGPRGETNCLHLLAAITKAPGTVIQAALAEFRVKPEDLLKRVMAEIAEGDGAEQPAGSSTPYLDRFGRDLTRLASEGKLGPLIGRRKELLQVIQTLARKTKSNPVLVGEAGVGKTETARALAARLFGSESQRICPQITQISQIKNSESDFRNRCESVESVDEEGQLTDAKGRTADARNAIFVMTSNITLEHEAHRPLGFGAEPEAEQPSDVRQELARRFRPEFINRIDEIVVFKSLGQDSARLILLGMLDDIAARLLKQHGVTLEVSEEAEELLLRTGFSAAFGARELRRTVERMLEMPLSQMVLSKGTADERRQTPKPEDQGKAADRTWRVAVKGEGLSITAG